VTEAELLAAVTAAPDDDAPRLVYAHRLLERDDPPTSSPACSVARLRLGHAGPRRLAAGIAQPAPG
jgi:uncharacterized protein (TIGR02996 family)